MEGQKGDFTKEWQKKNFDDITPSVWKELKFTVLFRSLEIYIHENGTQKHTCDY